MHPNWNAMYVYMYIYLYTIYSLYLKSFLEFLFFSAKAVEIYTEQIGVSFRLYISHFSYVNIYISLPEWGSYDCYHMTGINKIYHFDVTEITIYLWCTSFKKLQRYKNTNGTSFCFISMQLFEKYILVLL